MTTFLTRSQLLSRLLALKGATPIGITLLTTPKTRANPYRELRKLRTMNCFIGVNYEASVNRARKNDFNPTPFAVSARKWGHHISPAIVQHSKANGVVSHYLCAKIQSARKPVYTIRQDNGVRRFVRESEVAPFLPPEREQEIAYREINLDSIVKVNLSGERIRVVEEISTR